MCMARVIDNTMYASHPMFVCFFPDKLINTKHINQSMFVLFSDKLINTMISSHMFVLFSNKLNKNLDRCCYFIFYF